MSKLEFFLNNLSDIELAFFFKYRYNEFLDNSKIKINNEIKARNLSNDDLTNLILTSKISKNNHSRNDLLCPRCNSNKIQSKKKKKLKTFKWISYEKTYYALSCKVCGHSFKPPFKLF